MIETQIPGYEILSVLGRGGMGIVCRAVQASLERPVALKLLEPRLAADPDFVRRFQQEATTAAALDHPNIVRVYDFGKAGETYFIAMQLVRGETLDVRLRRGPLSPQEAALVLEQACAGLDYAHKQRVVHRDIKPGNIMIQPDGHVILMDFGLARACHSSVVTGARVSLGTPGYMAPEQCRGAAVDYRADLYSLGVVLFEILTGHRPFSGENPLAVYYQHVNADPPPLSQFRGDLPPTLDQVLQKALAKDPDDRYQSAGSLAAAFALACRQSETAVEEQPAPRQWNGLRFNKRECVSRLGHVASQKVFLALLTLAVIASGAVGYSIVSRVLGAEMATSEGQGRPIVAAQRGSGEILNAPSQLRAQKVSLHSVQLGWVDNNHSESGYVVERKSGAGNYVEILRTGGDTRSAIDTSTVPAASYVYRVKAIGRTGTFVYSESVEVSTPSVQALRERYEQLRKDILRLHREYGSRVADSVKGELAQASAELRKLAEELGDPGTQSAQDARSLSSEVLATLGYVYLFPVNEDLATARKWLEAAAKADPDNRFPDKLLEQLALGRNPLQSQGEANEKTNR